MLVGIDIDGTIDAGPAAIDFFRFLTQSLRAGGHGVVIVSHRPWYREEAVRQLKEWGIAYDQLLWADSRADKGELCRLLGVDVMFDDNEEVIAGIDQRTLVFRARSGFNFDFSQRKWLDTPDCPGPG